MGSRGPKCLLPVGDYLHHPGEGGRSRGFGEGVEGGGWRVGGMVVDKEESDRFPNAQKLSQQVMVMALGETAALHEQNPGRTRSERTEGRGMAGRPC